MATYNYAGTVTAAPQNLSGIPEAILEVFSLDILHAAMPVMRYEEFAVRKTELMVAPGQTINITTYADIDGGGTLTEGDDMSTEAMSAGQESVTVTEYGNAIGVTEKLLQVSFDSVMAEAALLLGRNYAKIRDLAVRNIIMAGGSNTLFTTDGAAAIADVAEEDTFDVESIRRAVEILQTANAPKFYNDFFVCFIHPHQAAYLRRDPDWIAAQHYAGSREIFRGELGRWEDVIFINSTLQQNGAAAASDPGYLGALDGTGDDGQNLYKATIIADQAYCVADALPVEMRDDGVKDFGRKHHLGWYGIWGQKVLYDDYIVHVISS